MITKLSYLDGNFPSDSFCIVESLEKVLEFWLKAQNFWFIAHLKYLSETESWQLPRIFSDQVTSLKIFSYVIGTITSLIALLVSIWMKAV